MSKPNFVHQTAEPMTGDEQARWFQDAADEMRKFGGAKSVRYTFEASWRPFPEDPDTPFLHHGICLCEGWLVAPTDWPEPAFSLTTRPEAPDS